MIMKNLLKKITKQNIANFIEGYTNVLKERFDTLPEHIKEQVIFRHSKCKDDCMVDGKCRYCKCPTPARHYATKTCDKGRFPDLMSKEDWEKYKKEYAEGI